jgi:hypothetical protein
MESDVVRETAEELNSSLLKAYQARSNAAGSLALKLNNDGS